MSKCCMARLLVAARQIALQWLGVAVPREQNVDADRLSHPSQAEAVMAEARAAGWQVERLAVPARCWEALESSFAFDAGEWELNGDDWQLS